MERRQEKKMKRYGIAAALILVAILTVDVCIPFAAGCIGTALFLTGIRHDAASSTN